MNNMNEEVEERGVEDTTDENEQPSCSSYPACIYYFESS